MWQPDPYRDEDGFDFSNVEEFKCECPQYVPAGDTEVITLHKPECPLGDE
jgi:hypothetical protein